MVKQAPLVFRDENGYSEDTIPVLFEESVGQLTFVSERSAKYVVNEDGERTDEIRSLSIEVMSTEQKTSFNVDLPPMFNLSALGLKYGDLIRLNGVKEATAWALLPQGSQNAQDAITGFSFIAESVEKGSRVEKAAPTEPRPKETKTDSK